MHEPLLGRAAKPVPQVVLGLLLKPFSLGHELLLLKSGNPLATSNKGTNPQLKEAVLICAHSWKENKAAGFDPLLRLKLWIWQFRIRRFNFADHLKAFAFYRDAGTLEFPLSNVARPNSGPAARVPGCPFILRLQQFLMTHLGLSEDAAWDYPAGLAKMRWATYWEQEGGLDVYNHTDAAHDAFVATEEAKEAQCRH